MISNQAGTIKSIQRGVVTIADNSATGTATISAVNTAKSVIEFLGGTGAGTSDQRDSRCTIVLTNSTTVTATRIGAFNACDATFQVTEFF